MMIINILPDSIKKEVKLNLINLKIKNLFLFFTVTTCLCGMLYLGGLLFARINYYNIIHSSNLLLKSTETNTVKVKEINSQMLAIEKIQNEFTSWSDLLKYFSANLSGNIKINQLRGDKISKQLIITGTAKTRDDLLALKNQLESAPYLTKIDFPIKNLLEKENINFEITAEFLNYEF